MVVLYHYTSAAQVEAIVREGFRDGEGTYGTGQSWRGVWLADRPLDVNETARSYRPPAWVRVTLDLPATALDGYEWVSEEGTYREWLIPAALLNAQARVEPYDAWADEASP
jgi:hypothetical protein